MATRSALWFLAFCGFTPLTECFTFLQSPVHIIGAKVARRRRHSLRSGNISLKVSRMPPTDSSYTMTPKELESMKATQPKSKEEIAKEIARVSETGDD